MAKLAIVSPNESEKPFAIEKPAEQLPVVKKEEFEAFVLWCSIPVFLKRPPRDKKTGHTPEVREFCESLGIEDERVFELAELKNQNEFAARFDLSIDTLTDWKKLILERDLLGDLQTWAKPLSRNVLMSLYNNTLRGGLPEHYALWFKLAAGWSDKLNVDIRKRVIKTVRVEIVDPKDHVG